MSLEIVVPDSPWVDQNISLGGLNYNFTYSYNSRDKGWRVGIRDSALSVIILGVKLVPIQEIGPNKGLLQRYLLPEFSHGDIYCIQEANTTEPLGRDNLGVGRSYTLIYLTNDEILEAQALIEQARQEQRLFDRGDAPPVTFEQFLVTPEGVFLTQDGNPFLVNL